MPHRHLTSPAGAATFLALGANESSSATGKLFADLSPAPAVQAFARRVECAERCLFPASPRRRSRFSPRCCKNFFHNGRHRRHGKPEDAGKFPAGSGNVLGGSPLFYPAWETCRTRTSSACRVISDRLQTLVALSDNSSLVTRHSPLIVTSVTALVQKHSRPVKFKAASAAGARRQNCAARLIEFLEEQGYEPERRFRRRANSPCAVASWTFSATSRGGAAEFFGDELESLRYFDPLTQISREEISNLTLPPAANWEFSKKEVRRQKSEVRRKPCLPRCWITCRAKRFFFYANRNRSPFMPMLTNSRFQKTIHFSFRGRIFWLN